MNDVLRQQLDEAEVEIAMLKRQMRLMEADAFVERGMRLGKVLDSNGVDWRHEYLRDPDAAEAKLGRAPVVLPPGRMLALNRRGEVDPQPRPEPAPGVGAHGPAGIGPEDMAAYEQAAAAGRVMLAGQTG
jgi:hypothetical protein